MSGGAITIFPEGKSHSEPQLAALKTGAARIALKALAGGADVTVVPVGLTYARKHRFRSEVCIEVGAPIRCTACGGGGQRGDNAPPMAPHPSSIPRRCAG